MSKNVTLSMILCTVSLLFSLLHADNLKECESEEDKKLCVVKQNYDNGNLEFELLMLKMR